MALNRSDKSRILRRYFPGMTRNSEMSTKPSRRMAVTIQMLAVLLLIFCLFDKWSFSIPILRLVYCWCSWFYLSTFPSRGHCSPVA